VRGMFRGVGALGAVALLALGVGACGDTASTDSGGATAPSPSPASPSQTVTVDSVGVAPKAHMKVGDTLVVTLHSNASTGYQWKAEGLEEEAVLKQDGGPEIVAPKSDLAGAPGKTKFTFVAEEEGTEELGFWYMPPGEGGEPGAGYALIVKVGKGHIPVDVKAGEEYTAETAELRTGDTLVVTLRHASDQGRHAWQMVGGSPFVKLGSQKYTSGTETLTFSGASAGTGTLVLVNRPGGDPPLQTFAVPIYVKAPTQPVTHQLNHNDNNENLVVRGGDTIQVSLQDQPSTDYQWEFQKLNAKVLKQVGKPKFFPNSDAIGAKGKMVWTFSVVGAGKAPLIASYNTPQADTMPIKTWQVDVAAKPGFTPKTVGVVDTWPADSVHVLPGDEVKVHLNSSAGAWVDQTQSKQVTASKPAASGDTTVITFKAEDQGIVTPLMLAETSGNYPAQAYALTINVGKGSLPKTVTAAERHVAKTITAKKGESFDIVLPSNSASTGFAWTTAALAPDGIIEQAGDPTVAASGDMPGAPGTTTMHYKAVGSGSVPLILLLQAPGDSSTSAGIYMTMVTVE
jgi:predicted secreted protein